MIKQATKKVCKLNISNFLVFSIICYFIMLGASHAFAGESSFCNYAPYEVTGVIINVDSNNNGSNKNIQIPPGVCKEFHYESNIDNTLVYAYANNSTVLNRLNRYSFFSVAWQGLPVWGGESDEFVACVSEDTNKFVSMALDYNCGSDQFLIALRQLGKGVNEHFPFFIIDNYICENVTEFDCGIVNLNFLSYWAKQLNISLMASFNIVAPTRLTFGLIPYGTGFITHDENGEFDIGVIVTDQLEATPLGSSVNVIYGDKITMFNNRAVFNRNDLGFYILEHAENKGYNEPYVLRIIRSGIEYEVQGYQFFHREPFKKVFQNSDGTCRNKSSALLRGALDEASFYFQSIIACTEIDTVNNDLFLKQRCKFRTDQLIAAYKQFCPNETNISALIGGLYLPGRHALEKMVFKGTALSSRVLRAIVIDGSEEALRSTLSLPPGIKATDSIQAIFEDATLPTALGVAFAIALPGSKRGTNK